MKDHLEYALLDGKHAIAWYLVEDDELGSYVGDLGTGPHKMKAGTTEDERIDNEVRTVDNAAYDLWKNSSRKESGIYRERPMGTYFWETRSRAMVALRALKAALKAFRSKKAPLEEWEQKALAAGWKPPKGRL